MNDESLKLSKRVGVPMIEGLTLLVVWLAFVDA
jgi:hypothetical protein